MNQTLRQRERIAAHSEWVVTKKSDSALIVTICATGAVLLLTGWFMWTIGVPYIAQAVSMALS